MSDAQYRRAEDANEYSIKLDTYVKVQELLSKYDSDQNGSCKQAEVKVALDVMGTSLKLTTQQKAVPWQLVTGSSSEKNNPYDKAVGKRVIDSLAKLKESEGGTLSSFSDEIMCQLMARA